MYSSQALTPIYATPVYTDSVESTVTQRLHSVQEQLEYTRTAPALGQANELTHIRDNQFEQCDLLEVENSIHHHLTEYMQGIGFAMRPYRVHGWFTRNHPGDYLQLHHHNDVDIAGTIYIQTDPACGDFYFESPVGAAPHSMVFAHLHNRVYITPQAGQIVLFPGWIQHGVLRNNSNITRLGLSFNISFKR